MCWGAGATYDLSKALNANSQIKSAGYRLAYTAYIDAITHYWIGAETRRPVGTAAHDNYFQRRDWLLKGNSVSQANNVNVSNASWGKNLRHTSIDDNATVQAQLASGVGAHVLV